MADIENNSDKRDLGPVTAYGMALVGGYTGTYEDFCYLLAHYTATADEIRTTDTKITNEYNIIIEKDQNATASATKAESYAVGGTGSRDGEDADNAKQYAQNASDSADDAEKWAVGVKGSGSNTPSDSNNAYYWSEQAKNSADSASTDSNDAQSYKRDAETAAKTAQSYATGDSGNGRENEATDNAKSYYNQVKTMHGEVTSMHTDVTNSRDSASDSAELAQKWAVGETPEDKYKDPSDTNNAKYWAGVAESFSSFNAPSFEINLDTMELVMTNAGDHIVFNLDDNKVLSYQVTI